MAWPIYTNTFWLNFKFDNKILVGAWGRKSSTSLLCPKQALVIIGRFLDYRAQIFMDKFHQVRLRGILVKIYVAKHILKDYQQENAQLMFHTNHEKLNEKLGFRPLLYLVRLRPGQELPETMKWMCETPSWPELIWTPDLTHSSTKPGTNVSILPTEHHDEN